MTFNSGQIPQGSKIFIHRKVYNDVLAGLKDKYNSWKVGRGQDESVHQGPLITQKHKDSMHGKQLLNAPLDSLDNFNKYFVC